MYGYGLPTFAGMSVQLMYERMRWQSFSALFLICACEKKKKNMAYIADLVLVTVYGTHLNIAEKYSTCAQLAAHVEVCFLTKRKTQGQGSGCHIRHKQTMLA